MESLENVILHTKQWKQSVEQSRIFTPHCIVGIVENPSEFSEILFNTLSITAHKIVQMEQCTYYLVRGSCISCVYGHK